jgi:3-hydroxyisobutyrate dehydrogenase-like beta-hydroxyacid dehydrogenase
MKVVVVGLGNLGAGVADGLLRAGHEVVGVDPSASARTAWAVEGSLAVAVLDDIDWDGVVAIFVVVLLTDQVHDTLLRLGELFAGSAQPRTVYVISTLTADFAGRLPALNRPVLRVIESPISGGASGARAGTLSVMLGGPVIDADVALFESTIAGKVTVFADYRQPTVAKLLNNAIMAVQVQLVADTLELSERVGLDAGRLYDFMLDASGSSRAATLFRRLNAQMLDKDVRLLLESFPESEQAGLFGRSLRSVAGLEDRISNARGLLDGQLDSPDQG